MMRGTYQALHNIRCDEESRKRKADKYESMAEKIKIYEEALNFMANQKDKTGNWAVEIAIRAIRDASQF